MNLSRAAVLQAERPIGSLRQFRQPATPCRLERQQLLPHAHLSPAHSQTCGGNKRCNPGWHTRTKFTGHCVSGTVSVPVYCLWGRLDLAPNRSSISLGLLHNNFLQRHDFCSWRCEQLCNIQHVAILANVCKLHRIFTHTKSENFIFKHARACSAVGTWKNVGLTCDAEYSTTVTLLPSGSAKLAFTAEGGATRPLPAFESDNKFCRPSKTDRPEP